MANLKDLLAQKQALETQIAEMQREARAQAIADVRELMSQYGLTIDDLGGRSMPLRRASKPIAAKYINKATGDTWSGRGLQPRWLKTALAGGAKLEDFTV